MRSNEDIIAMQRYRMVLNHQASTAAVEPRKEIPQPRRFTREEMIRAYVEDRDYDGIDNPMRGADKSRTTFTMDDVLARMRAENPDEFVSVARTSNLTNNQREHAVREQAAPEPRAPQMDDFSRMFASFKQGLV